MLNTDVIQQNFPIYQLSLLTLQLFFKVTGRKYYFINYVKTALSLFKIVLS